MSDVFYLRPDAKLLHTFNFSQSIPSVSPAATISSVAYTIAPASSPRELYEDAHSEDFANFKSGIRLAGARSGVTYQVTAIATLSNGDDVPMNITVKGYDG